MEEQLKQIFNELKAGLNKVEESFKQHLGTIRAGRASPSILDNVVIVDETGGTINLKSCATVTVSGMNITIQAYNNSYVKMIEKGIQQSNLGLTPNVNGTSIKLFLPPLTEETRKNLLKVVSETGNTFKTSVKQVREQSMKKLKAMKADKLLPEDDFKVNEKAIETQIQNCNSLIDDLLKKKEKDITEI